MKPPMFPFITESSAKYLRSFLKNFPNKIYSVEIKIKSEDAKKLVDSASEAESVSQRTIKFAAPQVQQVEASPVAETVVPKSDVKSAEPRPAKLPKLEGPSHGAILERTSQLARSMRYTSVKPSLPALVSLNALLKELHKHLQTHPEASNYIIREKIVPKLLRIREASQRKLSSSTLSLPWVVNSSQLSNINQNHYSSVYENSRQVLSLLGYADPPKGKGIKILSIDGGGTRGIIVIEILRQIERLCGKPIHQIFDVICGVSTGSIIAMLLGALRISIDECEEHYRQVSSYLFKTDILRGTGRLLWSHAYYDTAVFEKILKEIYGETVMVNTRRDKHCPHILAVSAIVNLPALQPYLFRNYELHPSSKPLSHFEGSSSHKIWEAVRASTAAPGYFEELTLGSHVHQDGGILLNNPTAVAVHEAKLLWPNEPIQCVLSLGSGRYQPATSGLETDKTPATLSSLKHKILRLIDSATDTEMVHRLMQDLLPPNTYYRINPVMRDPAGIDENRPEKLEQMKEDAVMYLRKNDHKFKKTIEQLNLERTLLQRLSDSVRLKSKLYL